MSAAAIPHRMMLAGRRLSSCSREMGEVKSGEVNGMSVTVKMNHNSSAQRASDECPQ